MNQDITKTKTIVDEIKYKRLEVCTLNVYRNNLEKRLEKINKQIAKKENEIKILSELPAKLN